MIPLLKYKNSIGGTLEAMYTLGLIYFIITDEYGRFVHCVFSGVRAREFVRVLNSNELIEVLDKGGAPMCLQPLKGGGFGISIDSKSMTKGFVLNQQQTEELINWCQMVHKL